MKKFFSIFFIVLSFQVYAEKTGRFLIVVPSRPILVSIAFDMAEIRNCDVISYYRKSPTNLLEVFEWDKKDRAWVKIEVATVVSDITALTPYWEKVILIDEEGKTPAEILNAIKLSKGPFLITDLKLNSVFNSLNEIFNFSVSEWRYFARIYRLELEDLNKDKRRYGRFGPYTKKEKFSVQNFQAPERKVILPEDK